MFEKLTTNKFMDNIKVEKGKQVVEYENPYFQVCAQEVDFGNFTKKYFVAQFGHKAGILIIKDDSVLLARQYRLLIDRPAWEVPGGKIEEGEEPEVSAIRECEEETGIRCLNVKPLIQYRLGNDAIGGGAYLFLSDHFEQVKEFEPNIKEVDMIRWVPMEESIAMIKSGEILDHFTIVALLSYQAFHNTKGKV